MLLNVFRSYYTYAGHPWIFLDASSGERLSAGVGRAARGVFECVSFIQELLSQGEIDETEADSLTAGRGLVRTSFVVRFVLDNLIRRYNNNCSDYRLLYTYSYLSNY